MVLSYSLFHFSFTLRSSWFLTCWVLFNWNLLRYIMNLWLFLNLLLYLIFSSTTAEGKVGMPPCDCQVETEVLFPHSGSTNTQSGDDFLLLLGDGRKFQLPIVVTHGGSGLVTTEWWWRPWLSLDLLWQHFTVDGRGASLIPGGSRSRGFLNGLHWHS